MASWYLASLSRVAPWNSTSLSRMSVWYLASLSKMASCCFSLSNETSFSITLSFESSDELLIKK
jgi:hypothetical protein